MSYYSTILRSNHVDGKSLVQQWLNEHKFFIGSDENDVNIIINDDLSISIKSVYLHEVAYPDIAINNLPPHGIKEIINFHWVTFINVRESNVSKLPRFKHCKQVDFEYCTLPKEYINERMNIKECTLV